MYHYWFTLVSLCEIIAMVSNIYEGVASGELRLICLGLGVRRDASYDWWFFWERHWCFFLRCESDLRGLFQGD